MENLKSKLREKYSEMSANAFDLTWQMAYDYGHAYGVSEVENYFIDLANFVKVNLVNNGWMRDK